MNANDFKRMESRLEGLIKKIESGEETQIRNIHKSEYISKYSFLIRNGYKPLDYLCNYYERLRTEALK